MAIHGPETRAQGRHRPSGRPKGKESGSRARGGRLRLYTQLRSHAARPADAASALGLTEGGGGTGYGSRPTASGRP